jgi:hypothetical protein
MDKAKDNFEDNIEGEAPLLGNIPKSNPFVIPEGYFDALPAQIMEACRQDAKKTTTSFATGKLFWLFRPQWMLATFMLIAMVCFLARNNSKSILSYEIIAASIPDSVIMDHLQSNIDYVDVTSLEEMAQNGGNIGALPPSPVQDTANRQIINYLMNNNIDASDIENEL